MQNHLTTGSIFPFWEPQSTNYRGDSYRYGFNGQEADNEISGSSGSYVSFKYRVHDARLGRFLSIDPISSDYPWNSPYAFSENRVIDSRELEGLERTPAGKDPLYDHLFNDNWTNWKCGNSVWFQSPSTPPIKIYQGSTSKITLVTYDRSQGYSLSHPDYIIQKMEPIASKEIPINTYAPVLEPISSPQLIMASNNQHPTITPNVAVPPVILGDETDMNVRFNGSSSTFVDNDAAYQALGEVITVLQNNPNLAVNLTVSTDLPEGDPDGALYLTGRAKRITAVINKIDNSLWDRITISKRYNETPAVKSNFKEIE